MRGTIVCGVTDGDEGHAALERGVELSQRLGLRLVLAHVAEGFAPLDGQGEDNESVTTKASSTPPSSVSLSVSPPRWLARSRPRKPPT